MPRYYKIFFFFILFKEYVLFLLADFSKKNIFSYSQICYYLKFCVPRHLIYFLKGTIISIKFLSIFTNLYPCFVYFLFLTLRYLRREIERHIYIYLFIYEHDLYIIFYIIINQDIQTFFN